MNSILRQSHIRSADLRNFLRNYDASNTTAVSSWAKAACAELEPGSLVFIVEPVTLPFGLISFSRKEEENFRVTDFAIIVRIEDRKAMVVSLTSNTYELRFLESLLEERARKSIIDRKKFNFVAAKPVSPLALIKFQELERLSNLYAKGGFRRNFMNTNTQEEPVLALLTACGVHLHFTSVDKQPADIGSICYSLFNTDMKLPDSNRSQLRETFVPLPSDFSELKTIPISPTGFESQGKQIDLLAEKPSDTKLENDQEITGFNLLQSWGGNSRAAENDLSSWGLVSAQSTEENNKLEEGEDSAPSLGSTDLIEKQESLPLGNTAIMQADDVYKHLSEAITDLLGVQQQSVVPPLEQFPSESESPLSVTESSPADNSSSMLMAVAEQSELSASIESGSDTNVIGEEPLVFEEPMYEAAHRQALEDGEEPLIFEEPMSISSIDLEDTDIERGDPGAIFSSVDMVPSKLDDFQEPKVVMNEMASLMSKLESQVARAAKKLAAKASEVEKRLFTNLDALLTLITQEDKDSYAELVVRIDVLSKQFESLFDTLKTELAEKAANSREQVKANLAAYQEKIDKTESEQRDNLIDEFKQNKKQFEHLVEEQESELNRLVDIQKKVLNERMRAVDQILEDSSVSLGIQLEDHFYNFKERVDEKVLTSLITFDHQINTLHKDIERSHSIGSEQLILAKNEFFSKLERLMQITEIDLSRQVRKAQTESFLPRLKERKQIIEAIMHEMTQTFGEHSFSQAKAQSEGAEHSLVLARQQLKELVEERLSKLDIVGCNQQTGLEEIFKSAADPLEQNTATVVQLLKQAEQEINECEAVCAKLAQSYNLDGDPKLTSICQDVYSKVDSLKAQLRNNLEVVLDENCLKLEDTTKSYHVRLNTKRAELVQQVRSASDKGLLSIRQAIHDAFDTIQSQREKYME